MRSGRGSSRCSPRTLGGGAIRSAVTGGLVEGIAYRYRVGMPWRDLPREVFGPWQTVWKRLRRYAEDGTWHRVSAELLAQADATGKVDWTISVDATISRAHQHGTNTTRPDQDTGGSIELQESAGRVRLQPAKR